LRPFQRSWRSGLVAGGAHFARAVLPARGHDALGLRLHSFAEPVQLDEEGGGGIARIAAAEGVLDGLDGQLVDHSPWPRVRGAPDHRGHRLRGRSTASKTASTVFTACGRRRMAHDDLGRDAEGALGAHEQAVRSIACDSRVKAGHPAR